MGNDGENFIRVLFSEQVNGNALRALHASPSVDQFPPVVSDLLAQANIKRLSEVYQVTQDEVESDKYGFAREFVCYLNDGCKPESAIKVLEKSPLVKAVRTSALRQTWSGSN